jgi:hypothetical protein
VCIYIYIYIYIYNKIKLNIKYEIGEPTIFSNKFGSKNRETNYILEKIEYMFQFNIRFFEDLRV